MTHNNIFAAWLSGRTVRKHTMHVHRRENIAEHTWGMLLLLTKYLPWASARLMRYIVLHDAGEQGACDVPSHLCREMPELKAVVQAKEDEHVEFIMQGPHTRGVDWDDDPLTPHEEAIAEILDRAEFVLSCHYDHQMGNQLVVRSMRMGQEMLQRRLHIMPVEGEQEAANREAMLALSRDIMTLLGPDQEKNNGG